MNMYKRLGGGKQGGQQYNDRAGAVDCVNNLKRRGDVQRLCMNNIKTEEMQWMCKNNTKTGGVTIVHELYEDSLCMNNTKAEEVQWLCMNNTKTLEVQRLCMNNMKTACV